MSQLVPLESYIFMPEKEVMQRRYVVETISNIICQWVCSIVTNLHQYSLYQLLGLVWLKWCGTVMKMNTWSQTPASITTRPAENQRSHIVWQSVQFDLHSLWQAADISINPISCCSFLQVFTIDRKTSGCDEKHSTVHWCKWPFAQICSFVFILVEVEKKS